MPKNNSAARREQRREVARTNATRKQINCIDCHTRHRVGRCLNAVGDDPAIGLLRAIFGQPSKGDFERVQ